MSGKMVVSTAMAMIDSAAMTGKTAKDFHPDESELKAAAVNYQAYIYPGVQHGFNNDTTPRYDEAAAHLARQRTIDFFNKYLRV